MNLNIKDKVAIVTGASRGIGKAIVYKLVSYGCKVVLISRNLDDLKKVEKDLNTEKVMCFQCDITKQQEFKVIVSKVVDLWGSLDILINNAGITKDKLLLRMNESDWVDVIDVNLKGCYNTIKVVSNQMIRKKQGKIVNITSVIGQIGNSGQANYAASKSGIEGLTRSLAVEFGSRNININCIAPGYIETDMTKNLDKKVIQDMKNNIPLNKFGLTSDISEVVCFLVSDLSSFITGQVINVDGGMTIK
tara:strand:- start:2398 stop:3141 length:744 start_codon:yes stop_codon:yes gene_type:complete